MSVAKVRPILKDRKFRWLVTGAAGFIGSNLTECLLEAGQEVVGLDDFSSGLERNLDETRASVSSQAWSNFTLVRDTLESASAVKQAMKGVDFVLHHGAFVSVPLSIENPELTRRVNVQGFRNVLEAAREARVQRVVYASSSAVYGSETSIPALETRIGRPLSPYAETKRQNELDAAEATAGSGLSALGLRYFNVYGQRQDHKSAYAAVIPTWVRALLRKETIVINGDGETTRDFCFVGDVVEANVRAALVDLPQGAEAVVNVAAGRQTSLNELWRFLSEAVRGDSAQGSAPQYRDFRPGDVRHSVADTTRERAILGQIPATSLEAGIQQSIDWYRKHLS